MPRWASRALSAPPTDRSYRSRTCAGAEMRFHIPSRPSHGAVARPTAHACASVVRGLAGRISCQSSPPAPPANRAMTRPARNVPGAMQRHEPKLRKTCLKLRIEKHLRPRICDSSENDPSRRPSWLAGLKTRVTHVNSIVKFTALRGTHVSRSWHSARLTEPWHTGTLTRFA
jgi:hypothetical protein